MKMKVFKVAEDGKCGYCLWDGPLYALAESQEAAEALYEKGDAGLCGECLIDLMVDLGLDISGVAIQDPDSVRLRLNSQD